MKNSRRLGDDGFNPTERREAKEIFRLLVNDAEVLVRQTLAETLKTVPDIPNDIAKTLVSDVTDVATPMISFSEALSDGDLFEIISSKSDLHQAAVAVVLWFLKQFPRNWLKQGMKTLLRHS